MLSCCFAKNYTQAKFQKRPEVTNNYVLDIEIRISMCSKHRRCLLVCQTSGSIGSNFW